MEECVRMMQQHLHAAPTTKKRAKTVYAQKNLGTIRDKKRQRRKEKEKEETNGSEVIMRILRMRYGFIPEWGSRSAQTLTQGRVLPTSWLSKCKSCRCRCRVIKRNVLARLDDS